MNEPKITYYATLAGNRTREDPSGIVRSTSSTPLSIDEYFGRDMQWHPTHYLRDYAFGHDDIDHEEITAEEAHVIIDRWCAKWALEDAQNSGETNA